MGKRSLGILQLLEQGPATTKKIQAFAGQADLPGTAVEQAHANPLFKTADTFSYCRRRDAQRSARQGKTLILRCPHKGNQPAQIIHIPCPPTYPFCRQPQRQDAVVTCEKPVTTNLLQPLRRLTGFQAQKKTSVDVFR